MRKRAQMFGVAVVVAFVMSVPAALGASFTASCNGQIADNFRAPGTQDDSILAGLEGGGQSLAEATVVNAISHGPCVDPDLDPPVHPDV